MKKYWFIITVSACVLAACSSQKKKNSDNDLQSNVNSTENLQKDVKHENSNNTQDMSFENTKWILKNIDGKEVEMHPENPAYIIFSDDDKISGSLGCNNFGGSYYLSGDILKLENIVSTQKACLYKNPENLFSSVLTRVDACIVIGNKLVFNQMGKEIATFEGSDK
ncbi:MAG: META domain-containing protein [Prevotellaceae bacterium]|jgi:putative lipoprotein|nr:META domain-containing protein [Prevotellaceae bacterium]